MHLRAIRSEAEEMAETFSVSQYHNVLNSQSLLQVYQLWNQYLEHLCHENSKLSAFWMSYIQLFGDVLLGLIHASHATSLCSSSYVSMVLCIRQVQLCKLSAIIIQQIVIMPIYGKEALNIIRA